MRKKACLSLVCVSSLVVIVDHVNGNNRLSPILEVALGGGSLPDFGEIGSFVSGVGASAVERAGVGFGIAEAPRSALPSPRPPSPPPFPPSPPPPFPPPAPTSQLFLPISSAMNSTFVPVLHAEIGGAAVNSDQNCPGPMAPPKLDKRSEQELLHDIGRTCSSWGYDNLVHTWEKHRGRRVLDIGMGQGPIGVIALTLGGVSTYTGLDPALCIDRPANTRYRKIGRTFGVQQCEEMEQICAASGEGKVCEDHRRCAEQLRKKYQPFPFTGLQMMQALPGRLVLLPGTFDSIQGSGLLRQGDFDVATMNAVTEHLPDVRVVVEGIFDILNPGQWFCASHHNYYGWAGHHMYPQKPADFDETSAAQRDFANWRHVDADSLGAAQENTNRVRLGDLVALFDVYFDCKFQTDSYPGVSEAVQKRLKDLRSRSFSKEELVVEHMKVNCVRRTSPLMRSRLDRAVWFHPPLDGSYAPQPLPKKIKIAMKHSIPYHSEHGARHPKC